MLGVLTNGLEWRFFTDTGDPNVMDGQPFHTAKLDAADQGLDVLARFAKSAFCAYAIRDYATELIYTARIAAFLRGELDLKDREPSEYLIRWILKSSHMYDGSVNQNVVERFRPVTRAALTRVLREVVRRAITAMDEEAAQANQSPPPQPAACADSATPTQESVAPSADVGATTESEAQRGEILTTEGELRVFAIVKDQWERAGMAACTIFDPSQRREVPAVLSHKDTTGYFGIFLNKPGWWAIRLVMEARRPWIGFNTDEATCQSLLPVGLERLPPSPWAAVRIAILGPDDVARLGPLVVASLQRVIAERKAAREPEPSKA